MINFKVGQTWLNDGGDMMDVKYIKPGVSVLMVGTRNEARSYLVGMNGHHLNPRHSNEFFDLTEQVTRVYIAGPMSGLPDFNFPAFHAAAAEYRKRGCFVINPAELNPDCPDMTGWTDAQRHEFWCDCMRRDIPALLTCEMIVMLPGWTMSKGATLEHTTATALKMAIAYPDSELSTSGKGLHIFWQNGDKNIPAAICDGNGQVALSLCKRCNLAEAELTETCPKA